MSPLIVFSLTTMTLLWLVLMGVQDTRQSLRERRLVGVLEQWRRLWTMIKFAYAAHRQGNLNIYKCEKLKTAEMLIFFCVSK